ncbi:MAG TPA: hypothetical protein PLP39_09075 [Flavobacterium lutivivi]|nr:hypothetical protein [Flavobacterium lutivivi]
MTKTELKKELQKLVADFFNEEDTLKAIEIKSSIIKKVLACPYGENYMNMVNVSINMWSNDISNYLTQKDNFSTRQAYLALIGIITLPDTSYLED